MVESCDDVDDHNFNNNNNYDIRNTKISNRMKNAENRKRKSILPLTK